ncbi:MAG TPA: acyl-CoA dehydrogenase family protein [Gemmatimonadaceae bacterium]|nr:acyl-CoA dehydrogenase family protein [Gemmatimonadaceae bacterium]
MADKSAALATEKEARDVAESARESEWSGPSFVRELFLGRFRLDLIHPHPTEDPEEEPRARPFFEKLSAFLQRVDSDMIDRTGEIPEEYVEELRAMGAFGIKIPREYGGLGLSYTSYVKAMAMVTSKDGSMTALLSAHQSIGLPQPLKLFGSDEQKRRFFPRLAKGAISAFALTEVDAGSDPANMHATAKPTEDGKFFILNGEKLWCTNGTRADLYVVMARTPDAPGKDGKPRKQITAFIVEANWPGVEIVQRCRFMGLKALENGLIRFTNVKVPRENILWGEGKGLKLALTTLNTGRLTLPASAAGGSKALLQVSRWWGNERVQWGASIGKHEAVAQKIGMMAANTFALEAISGLTVGLAEHGGYDIRLEAAIAKMYNTEHGWKIVDDTLQIRGGRGYETADSLRARGEPAIPVERAMRDSRINLIFEGSSEIMRLFIAREAVDHHFKLAFPMVAPESTLGERLKTAGKAVPFYATWYPSRWLPRINSYSEFGPLAKHLRFAERRTRKLGRTIFHAMLRYRQRLERKQMVLFRAVDIGAELFAMAAACVRAQMLAEKGNTKAVAMADLFCREARLRVDTLFDRFYGKNDQAIYRLAQQVLRGEHSWLEQGIISMLDLDDEGEGAGDEAEKGEPAAVR